MTQIDQVMCDWLPTLGWDTTQETGYPVLPGNYFQDVPDRIVFATLAGGPGYTTEEAATDAGSVQLRLRGPDGDPDEPGEMMAQLDQLILGASFPVTIDGVTIVHIGRQGTPPTPLPYDPTSQRFEFTCTYVIVHGGL